MDGLVEADRRFELLLQLRVIVDIVPAERLLDHDEVEGVERFQVRGVFQAIGGVRVDHQANARPAIAQGLDGMDVPAGLDFDFDALIAGG